MYKKILIPMALDHGIAGTALNVARALKSEGGEITAVHVYAQPEGSVSAYLDESVVRAAFGDAQALLNERIDGQPDVTGVLRKGHTARTIVDVANEIAADCIVIGSHKPGLADYLLGSTSSWVIRHAPCAVHVLRQQN
ncbi:MAG: universal stress protein [Pseudomonadota bacterium]